MYDQSVLELEVIQGDEKWSFEVLEAKFLTCKGAKKWEHAEASSNGMVGISITSFHVHSLT